MSKVIDTRDIKIAQIPFKEGNLDTTPTIIINVSMKSALVIDLSRFLVNTSMAISKSVYKYFEHANKQVNIYLQTQYICLKIQIAI